MIYVIDDDEDLTDVTCRNLQLRHYASLGFSQPQMALAALRAAPPTEKRLILVDFSMCGTDGKKQFWRELLDEYKPLVICTGFNADHPDLQNLPSDAITCVLTKPIGFKDLQHWINKAKIQEQR